MLEKIQRFNGSEVELEYLLTGEENVETIIFVHGAGSNLRQFKLQHEYLSKEFRVLSISLRGHGDSSNSLDNTSKGYTLEKNRDDILELLEYLKIEKIHYIGNSAGGLIGYELIIKKPQLFSSFITFGTTAELKLSKFVVNLISQIDRVMLRINPKSYYEFMSKHSSKYNNIQKEIYDLLIRTKKGILIRRNIGNYSYTNIIEKINIPFLVIKGEFDNDINNNLKTTIEAINNNNNASIIKLEGAGHFANLDKFEEFNRIIGEFIKSVSVCKENKHNL
ncbi:alpha/beta hydrolase [Tissierella sp. MSJ-40]|uniref:Alpha/beta hydrolase n=1 Tax=Tissierella simiarum TaxID=2841534 RepID=A0ABS6EAG5_9FIRM|nr:alpha/beta hydrolase [Tissierella simiarum]MBU5439194.1 alpha/beta hydrolase [Tissierella simiarum]